ncbi:MAG: alanine racemase [Gemmatimonadaceae bacterium]|nr:alanine racemase [Gemmatimonadaceae bacterium]
MRDARAWVEVDLGALLRNARALAAHARVPLLPMVKADAYGLGAVPVVRALETLDPFGYGVSSIAEGEELRAAGITRPILLFTPVVPSDLARLRAARLTPTLGEASIISAWAASGGGAWHLAVDTGMHRAGVEHDAIDAALAAAVVCAPEGIFTHLHSSEMDDGSMEAQETRFRAVLARLAARPRLVHVENSGGIVRRSPSAWDLVRPGVFLYGVGSGPKAALQPEPVASLRARILEVRTLARGETVSYGATWRAERVTKLATVACGYADGLRRHLGNRAHALVRGRPAPIAGVVTMDMTMLDITDSGGEVGDVATFLGRDGDALLTAEQVAAAGGLSPYELLVGLKLRLPRFHTES